MSVSKIKDSNVWTSISRGSSKPSVKTDFAQNDPEQLGYIEKSSVGWHPYKEQIYTIYIPEQDFPKLREEFLYISVSWSNPDLVGIKVMLKTDDNNYRVGRVSDCG